MRYVAFLRGVSPMNCRMPEFQRGFERAGFTDVKTVIASGNVVFNSPSRSVPALERRAEAAMKKHLGRSFLTIVRSVPALEKILARDPYARFRVRAAARRIVTFLRRRQKLATKLPLEVDGARILAFDGQEVLSAYVPSPRGPVFMTLIERTFGTEVTTRTWETIRRCTQA